MELFNWQINMKNGDKFIVKSQHSELGNFSKELLGDGKVGLVINTYETLGRNIGLINANAVAIINTEVSSIEYVTEWKYK